MSETTFIRILKEKSTLIKLDKKDVCIRGIIAELEINIMMGIADTETHPFIFYFREF